jgi:hypothetical protein
MLGWLRIACCSVLVGGTLPGCSMHPLPEDVSRKNTYDIVEKIRCEAAEGLRGIRRDHPILAKTYIGYDFDFDIQETNNLGTSGARGELTVSQKSAFPAGSLTLKSSPFAERSRRTQRTFRIVETLLELTNADCGPTPKRPNWVYPIAGAIGMQEVVSTYVRLERLTDFARPEVTTTKPIGTVFSDVLTFTTNFGSGLNPTLALASAVGNLKLTNASILADNTRFDRHKVTVALARDPNDEVDLPHGSRNTAAFRRMEQVRTADERYLQRNQIAQNRTTENQTAPTYTAPIYDGRLSRQLDAVARKKLSGETLVIIELERLRDQGEEDALATRLIDLLKATP